MFKIVHKQILAQDIKRVDIQAPGIASKIAPGQFVMVTVNNKIHSIAMSVVDSDERRGVISLIVHETGEVTKALGDLSIGEGLANVAGPLGKPAIVDKFGIVIAVATGIGAAQILPLCRALKKKGNKVIGVVGAKSKKVLMLESQMRVVCDEIFITTNDGSYERKGLATEVLKELLDKYKVNCVYAIGSVDMMEAASRMTQLKEIPIFVTLNPRMINGLGICGSCRVKVGGHFQLACIDGPQFNGHEVNFSDLHVRMNALKETGWDNQNPLVKAPRKDAAIFVKSLWGLPRK
ncbi:MAG: sulfide/dihydroorotate dehydrogenase-like FAD/NAD-binding protein [Candidatus Omnitrophota bacterium]